MSANKEAVISEKEMRCGFGQRVLVGYSEVIRSAEYDTVAAFTEAVQAEWDRQWHRIYTADWSSVCLAPVTCSLCSSAGVHVFFEQHMKWLSLHYFCSAIPLSPNLKTGARSNAVCCTDRHCSLGQRTF